MPRGRQKTNPLTPSDKRISYNHHRIEHEGSVWHIDAKYDLGASKLKVYHVYGDVSDKALLDDAIRLFMDAELLRGASKESENQR